MHPYFYPYLSWLVSTYDCDFSFNTIDNVDVQVSSVNLSCLTQDGRWRGPAADGAHLFQPPFVAPGVDRAVCGGGGGASRTDF